LRGARICAGPGDARRRIAAASACALDPGRCRCLRLAA
jgi:hypothetical protein